MGTTLVRMTLKGEVATFEHIDKAAHDYIVASMAPNTLRAYRSDWAAFVAFCEAHGLEPLPALPETVVRYASARAGALRPSSLAQHISAISQAHEAAGYDSPTRAAIVRKALAGIRRTWGVAPAQKKALTVADLQTIVREQLPPGLKGTRDRALLLIGFAGAFRRSELVAIDVEHIEWTAEGVVILVPRSKTDQEGEGRKVAIKYGRHPDTCPVAALKAWLEAASITSGAVFRGVDRHSRVGTTRLGSRVVGTLVQQYAAAIGLDPASFAGHSLRAGLVTAAAREGARELAIMRQTGHRSTAMLARYLREASLFTDNVTGVLDL